MDCQADDLLASAKIREAAEGKKVSVNDMIVMAAAKALRAVPEVNATWHDEHIELFPSANIAIAVAIEGGLVTPVIHQADSLSLSEISDRSAALAQSARAGELGRDELAGGTFTISNLGMYGIREFAAVINPPQGAILAVGACEKRPVVNGDTLDIATMMTVTLSCDHRVVDGAVGARWLRLKVLSKTLWLCCYESRCCVGLWCCEGLCVLVCLETVAGKPDRRLAMMEEPASVMNEPQANMDGDEASNHDRQHSLRIRAVITLRE